MPVVLLGHSMGARTAVHVADHPSVVGVVALAPWLERSDPVRKLAGKHLIAGHGRRDRITSARHDPGVRRPGAWHRGLGGVRRPRSVGSLHAPADRRLEPVRPAVDTHRVRSHSRSRNDSAPRMVDAGNVFNHFAGLHLR